MIEEETSSSSVESQMEILQMEMVSVMAPERKLFMESDLPLSDKGVTLVWKDLSVYVRKGVQTKSIISGVSGAVKPGSLVAIMGGSGAGKSTLMSALALKSFDKEGVTVEGDILINGKSISPDVKYISAFMHQENLFVVSQTVWEHMQFMARLKLSRTLTKAEREAKILEIIKRVGLTHCLHTKIGGFGSDKSLSGGEKKRLAFATELLTDPQLMFCDEPTTGLDSFSAQKIVSIMNDMARKGKTVLCTIHQPSSQIFAMFSEIILLAEGKIAFMGSTTNAMEFFSKMGFPCPANYNPADFLVKTLGIIAGHQEEECKRTVKKICNQFSVSDYAKEVDVLVQYEFHVGRAPIDISGEEAERSKYFVARTSDFKGVFWWTKLAWLTKRYFYDVLRNPEIQLLRIIQKIVIACMVGFCYMGTVPLSQNGIQSLQGALVTVICENTFPAMYSVLAEFPSNVPLFLREYEAGMYSPATFYAAKVIAMLPGIILEPFLFVMMMYWQTGLRNKASSFLYTSLTAILVMNVSSACGIFFSNAFGSVNFAMLCLVPFDYVLMITSGFFINLSSLGAHISWTKYLSWLMYGMESLTIIQWSGVNNISCETTTGADQDLPCLRTGDQVLDKYSFRENHFDMDLWILLIMCVAFHSLAFLFLLKRIHDNKK